MQRTSRQRAHPDDQRKLVGRCVQDAQTCRRETSEQSYRLQREGELPGLEIWVQVPVVPEFAQRELQPRQLGSVELHVRNSIGKDRWDKLGERRQNFGLIGEGVPRLGVELVGP